jgi:ArpU family phage transcriptional regulator
MMTSKLIEARLTSKERRLIQQAVEEAFERYRLYNFLKLEKREARITVNYEARPNGPTNKISDQTGDIAVYNVDEPARRQAYIERIEQAVECLPFKEQLLVKARYMQKEETFDYVVYNQVFDPPISEGTYAKIRRSAFYLLSLALRIDVGFDLIAKIDGKR